MCKSVVELRRGGQGLIIRPQVPELMLLITTNHHVAVDNDKHGICIQQQELSLVWPSEWIEEPVLETFAGSEPQIKNALERLGYHVRLTGQRPAALPKPLLPKSGEPQPDIAVLDFVRNNERGVIRYDPAKVHIERLIAQIAEAFPKQRILIVARRQNDVRRMCTFLRDSGTDAGQFIPNFEHRGHERVTVTTYLGVSVQSQAQFRDIVFYLNPAESMGWLGISGLGHLHRARLFGLMPYGLDPPSPVRDFISAVFGQETVFIPKDGWIARDVQVVFVPARVSDVGIKEEDELAVRRRAIWHHPVRNRRIADLAKMLMIGSTAKLKKEIPGFAKLVFNGEGGRVGVLVDSVEHGLALRRHLGWPLMSHEGVCANGLSMSDAKRLNSIVSDPCSVYGNVIVTAAAMPQSGIFDIIIRADAGIDLPALYDHHLLG